MAGLLEQLRDPAAGVRSKAMWTLLDRARGLTGGERVDVEDAVRRAVAHDPDVNVRFEAVLVLDQLGRREDWQPVVDVLRGDEGDQVMAATVAAWFPRPEVVDALLGCVGEGDVHVQEAAVASLADIGDPRAVPAIEAVLATTSDEDVEAAALAALRRLRAV